jgi:N-formylglutamate amidohydrolase
MRHAVYTLLARHARRCWSACRTSARRIPDDLRRATSPRALAVEDTDWHLDRCTPSRRSWAPACSCRVQLALRDRPEPAEREHADVRRANNTELCPTRFFTGEPIYRDGQAPDAGRGATRGARPTGSPTTTRWAPSWRA